MHEYQKRLLALARLENLDDMSYRDVAARIGCNYPSQVKHHLEQLIKAGYLTRNAVGRLIVMSKTRSGDARVVMVPILGEADCGEATKYASDEIVHYLTLSPNVLGLTDMRGLFALKARGNSMDAAQVNGSKPIRDGDYILVRKCGSVEVKDRDYVVSVIQGLANVKRLRIDPLNRRVVLMPESHGAYPPIIIAEEDLESYEIAGRVVDVVRGIDDLATQP